MNSAASTPDLAFFPSYHLMSTIIRAACVVVLFWVTAGKASAQDGRVIAALPADRLYVATIIASIPGYDAMTDVEKVRALRRYVYQHTPVGDPLIHDQVVGLPLREAYKILSKARGGVYCAGAATMLSRVYKAAGFNSWIYNFGEVGGPTHETTLVEVDGEVILQDAYLDFEYVDAHGMPIPFVDLISRIVDGSPPTAEAGALARVWLFSGGFDVAGVKDVAGPYKDTVACENMGAALRCSAVITLSRALENLDIADFLKRRGLPPQVEYLMLYPLGLGSLYSNGADQAEMLSYHITQKIRNLPLDVRLKMHALPSIDTLTEKSNIEMFMKEGVPEDLRMLALYKHGADKIHDAFGPPVIRGPHSVHQGAFPVEVSTPPKLWAIGAQFPLQKRGLKGPLWVSIRANVRGGPIVGIGVFNKEGSKLLSNTSTVASGDTTITLYVPEPQWIGDLVVESGAEGTPVNVTVDAVTVLKLTP